MVKGQLEFVIVLGVVIVAIVGVLYATQVIPPLQLPGNVEQDKNIVRDAVQNMILTGAQSVLSDLSDHGGYLGDPSVPTVAYAGKKVPYWQRGGQITVPPIESHFVQGMRTYIENNKNGLKNTMDREVSFGAAEISSVRFLENQIEMDVTMPTTLHLAEGNYIVEQPYRISIPTKFGDITEFAERFVTAQTTNRFFEYYTVASMLQSEFDDGVQKVPILVYLTECGEFVFKTSEDIRPDLEFTIESTLLHTYMPGKVPLNVGDSTSFAKYTLPELGGKEYPDLDVRFTVPDRFSLSPPSYQMDPNPVIAFPEHVPLTGLCQSDPLKVNYFIEYPAVVRVTDPLTGNVFQYAIQSYIKDNKPGDFSQGVGGYIASYQEELCQSRECSTDLLVTGSDERPLRASVNFMGCHIGTTGEDGILRAQVPCGVGPLEIYKTGYAPLQTMKGSHELLGGLVSLKKIPLFTIHFHEVNINKLPSGSYVINPTGVRELNDIHNDQAVTISFQSPENAVLCNNGICQWYFSERTGRINNLPVGLYAVSAALLAGDFVSTGMMNTPFDVTEAMDGEEVHVYLPYYLPFKSITDPDEQLITGEKLSTLLERCGVGPISLDAVELDVSCIKSEGELL